MRMVTSARHLFASRDGLPLAVEVRGAGKPTLLFAHGFGQTRGAWSAAATALAASGCRCVSFDSRGHGESGWVDEGEYHMDQFVGDLHALAAAQPEPPILVGASMGGLLGIVLAGETRPAPFAALGGRGCRTHPVVHASASRWLR